MRATIRLLLALTPKGWGHLPLLGLLLAVVPLGLIPQPVQAATYSWFCSTTGMSRSGSSPEAACSAVYALMNGPGYLVSCSMNSVTNYSCTGKYLYSSGSWLNRGTTATRSGDSCPTGKFYNPQTGLCDSTAPQSCSDKPDIYSAQECTYIESAKVFSCPTSVTYEGCEFVSAPDGKKNCDISTSICVNRYAPSGAPSQSGDPQCSESTCAELPEDPGQAPENCVTGGGNTYCFEDQESGCGTFNGQQGCFEHETGCGYFNGTWGCYGTDQDSRNCGYANGQRVCFNPDNPTEQIPPTSPDHPNNGGNADGNENNDPTAPGSTGGSSQGADDAATNESIDELGELLGPKIDKTNSLLDGISDQLSELTEGLFGDEYNDSQVGTADGIKTDAQGFGDQLGQMLTEQGEQIISEREDEAKTALEETIPKAVAGIDGMLGPDSPAITTLDLLNGVLPTASGCMDYPIDFELGDYNSILVLPVCELTRLKPLLEYVIWIITLIGLWKILYSGLRLEDAKASKGGF